MKSLLSTVSVAAIVLVFLSGIAGVAAAVTVAGHADMANFAFSSGIYMADARASLTDPGNFGPGGIVPEIVDILPDLTGPITTASLDGVDVFITSINRFFTPAEAGAVYDFVAVGGSLIFYGDVGVNFGDEGNSMAFAFGITFSDDDFVGGPNEGPDIFIDEPLHPTIDGPFGTSAFVLDATGSIVAQTNALTIATIASGPTTGRAFMVVQEVGTGLPVAGRAVWFCDANILANNTGLYTDNEVLFLNTFAWAAGLTGPVATEELTWSEVKQLYH